MQIFKYIHKKTNKCVNRKWKYELFQTWVVQKRSIYKNKNISIFKLIRANRNV